MPSVPMAIVDQWNVPGSYIKYSWDFDLNCYSEVMYGDNTIIMGTVTCRNKTTTIDINGRCTTTNSTANITQTVLN